MIFFDFSALFTFWETANSKLDILFIYLSCSFSFFLGIKRKQSCLFLGKRMECLWVEDLLFLNYGGEDG